HPAPLAIYPLRTALGGLIHFLIALLVVVGLSWSLKGLGNVPALWGLLPGILMLSLFAWSLATLAGVANVHFQDAQHLTEVGFRFRMSMPAVTYPRELVTEKGLGWLVDYNPLAAMLDLVRFPIVKGELVPEPTFQFAFASVAAVAGCAIFTLARCQKRLV